MVEREIFRNAPIIEALLDIRVTLPDNIRLEQLLPFHERVRARYPNKRDRKMWKSSIHLKDKGPEIAGPLEPQTDVSFLPSMEKTSFNAALMDLLSID
jgi:uncharacterized protein (TIGR04255 family)